MNPNTQAPVANDPWGAAAEVESGGLVKWADKNTKIPYTGKVVVCIPVSVEERDNTRGEGKSYLWTATGYVIEADGTSDYKVDPLKFFAPTDLREKLTRCVNMITRIEVLNQEEQKSGNMMTKFKVVSLPDTPENRVLAKFEAEW